MAWGSSLWGPCDVRVPNQGFVSVAGGQHHSLGLKAFYGDLNCDGDVNVADIDPFVLAFSDPASYAAQFPRCHVLNGDCNGDGNVDFGDIDPFVAILSGG